MHIFSNNVHALVCTTVCLLLNMLADETVFCSLAGPFSVTTVQAWWVERFVLWSLSVNHVCALIILNAPAQLQTHFHQQAHSTASILLCIRVHAVSTATRAATTLTGCLMCIVSCTTFSTSVPRGHHYSDKEAMVFVKVVCFRCSIEVFGDSVI